MSAHYPQSPVGRSVLTAALLFAAALTASQLPAQDEPAAYERATSPYTGEFAYRVDGVLRPRVDVEGLRLELIRIEPKSDDYKAGKSVSTFVVIALSNTGNEATKAIVVLLLEDEYSMALDRLELKPIKVGGGDTKEEQQKFKVQADALEATEKLYVFLEVVR